LNIIHLSPSYAIFSICEGQKRERRGIRFWLGVWIGRKMEDGEQQQSEKEPGNEVRPIKSLLRNGNGCGRRDEWLWKEIGSACRRRRPPFLVDRKKRRD
jgi:hypothetical protein